MKRFKWLVLCFCCLFSVCVTAENRADRVAVVPGSEARIFNVRLYQDTDGSWLLRGRITRADKDTKVPAGQVVVTVYDTQGKQVFTQSSHYKPGFVHRKTKRASYFTLRVPAQINMENHTVQLLYRHQSP